MPHLSLAQTALVILAIAMTLGAAAVVIRRKYTEWEIRNNMMRFPRPKEVWPPISHSYKPPVG